MVNQIVVNLARASQNTFDSGCINSLIHFTDHRHEVTFSQIAEGRGGVFITQQGLGRHDDQGLAERTDHLAAQYVEDLGTVSGLNNLNVVVGAQLQETLDTGGGVLWALTFVTVWQHQGQTAMTAPLGFARGNELINHNLGTVGKIAKLGFPDSQDVGFCRRITVFKSQHGFFGQDRVDNRKACLTF